MSFIYRKMSVMAANRIKGGIYSKAKFYKRVEAMNENGIYQKFNRELEGQKLTRFERAGKIYFALGWNNFKNKSLFVNVGFKDQNAIRTDFIYNESFKLIDKLIVI